MLDKMTPYTRLLQLQQDAIQHEKMWTEFVVQYRREQEESERADTRRK